MAHLRGYRLIGDGDVVCFFVDPVERAHITASTTSVSDCPVVWLGRDHPSPDSRYTQLEFPAFPGWRFFAGGDGKSIAITLVRRAAELVYGRKEHGEI